MAAQQNPLERIVRLEAFFHNGTKRIALHFAYDKELIALAKEAGASWSNSKRRWHVADGSASLKLVFAVFKGHATIDRDAFFAKPASKPVAAPMSKAQPRAKPKAAPVELGAAQQEALEAMQRKLEIARYSPNTIDTYTNATKHFFLHFPQKEPKDIRAEDIEAYQHELATARKVSNSYLNQVVNAVRYFYKEVLGDAYRVKFIEQPRGERKLPKVLSEQEVAAILKAPTNLKHRCILMLIYSAGLRLGELIALERTDIIPERKQVLIRGGKGGKDRVSLLSERLLTLLKEYLKTYEPRHYLFEGPKGAKYSDTSVQQVKEEGRDNRTSYSTYPTALFRYTPFGEWNRPPLYSGPPGAQLQQDYRDLHPCQHQGHRQDPQSTG